LESVSTLGRGGGIVGFGGGGGGGGGFGFSIFKFMTDPFLFVFQ
jgi:hypothetical protein